MQIPATMLTSEAIEGEVPSWYTPGTDGAEASILTTLGINEDEVNCYDIKFIYYLKSVWLQKPNVDWCDLIRREPASNLKFNLTRVAIKIIFFV